MPGIDFKLFRLDDGFWDIGLDLDGDFATEDAFDTAIIVSLETNARADASEVVVPELRQGWTGDLNSLGRIMGGKIWLWFQARLTNRTTEGLVRAAEEALAWFKADGWVDQSPTAQALQRSSDLVELEIVITHPNGEVDRRYFDLWSNTGDTLGS